MTIWMVSTFVGCVQTIHVEKLDLPTARVPALDLHVALFFSPELREYVADAALNPDLKVFRGEMRYEIGESSVAMLEQVFGAVFAEASVIDSGDPKYLDTRIDGLIVPEIQSFEAPLDQHESFWGVHSVDVEYSISVWDRHGNQILSWSVIGHSSNEGFQNVYGHEQTAQAAIRDAAASILREFTNLPEIRNWSDRQ